MELKAPSCGTWPGLGTAQLLSSPCREQQENSAEHSLIPGNGDELILSNFGMGGIPLRIPFHLFGVTLRQSLIFGVHSSENSPASDQNTFLMASLNVKNCLGAVSGEIRRGWRGFVNPYFKWVLSLPFRIWNWRWIFQVDSF